MTDERAVTLTMWVGGKEFLAWLTPEEWRAFRYAVSVASQMPHWLPVVEELPSAVDMSRAMFVRPSAVDMYRVREPKA